MAKRKPISARTRFEVFKRDSFKCQYCGKSAPEVILHVDHIKPVSKGGDNEIVNLVTSCDQCNLGKSDVELSDNAAVTKQKAMLDQLNERREQMEMMLLWREQMKGIDEMAVNAVSNEINSHIDGKKLSEYGLKPIKSAIKRFGLNEVLDAVDMILAKYNGKYLTDSDINDVLDGIAKTCVFNRMPDDRKRLSYIAGILNNRLPYFNRKAYFIASGAAIRAGVTIKQIEDLALKSRNWTGFIADLSELEKGILK